MLHIQKYGFPSDIGLDKSRLNLDCLAQIRKRLLLQL